MLSHRSKLAEEQQTAARAEQTAQHNVEAAHNALTLAGGSQQQVQVSTPQTQSQGHTNTSTPQKSSKNHSIGSTTDNISTTISGNTGNSGGSNSKKNTTTPSTADTTTAPTTPASTTPAVPLNNSTTPTASPSELRAAAAERMYNQAKLDLVAAEDNFEQRRTACEQMDASLLTESTRVEALERAQLMVRKIPELYSYFDSVVITIY